MRFTRIYSAEDGTAHFGDEAVTFTSSAFAPPAPPLDVSSAVPAREMLYIHFPAGWTDPAHPAPARQWMFILSGRGETIAGGETRSWTAGDVFLLEDTSGLGHGTTAFEESVMAVVRT
jgi:quercetin dioxygenase-like cupin family protein